MIFSALNIGKKKKKLPVPKCFSKFFYKYFWFLLFFQLKILKIEFFKGSVPPGHSDVSSC
jgi:hypothetical protein